MKTINLELTIDETNIMLEALGQMPFVRVYELVNKIQTQASHQLGEGETSLTNGIKPENDNTK